MREQLMKTHKKLREKMKKHDEAILKLLRQGHEKIIVQIISDYLSSLE